MLRVGGFGWALDTPEVGGKDRDQLALLADLRGSLRWRGQRWLAVGGLPGSIHAGTEPAGGNVTLQPTKLLAGIDPELLPQALHQPAVPAQGEMTVAGLRGKAHKPGVRGLVQGVDA